MGGKGEKMPVAILTEDLIKEFDSVPVGPRHHDHVLERLRMVMLLQRRLGEGKHTVGSGGRGVHPNGRAGPRQLLRVVGQH